jgi:hypothetical protein
MGRSVCKDIAAKFEGDPLRNDFMLIREGLKKQGMDPRQASIEAERQARALPGPTGNRFHYGADIQNADERDVTLKLAQIAYKAGDKLDKPKASDDPVKALSRQLVGKQAKLPEILSWIYNNAASDLNDLDPDEIPSAGALYHLKHVQTDSRAYGEFLQIWAKLIPTKQQIDMEERFRDDGRKTLSTIDIVMAELDLDGVVNAAESAQGLTEEPRVS